MSFLKKVKAGVQTSWNWMKKHPGETCMAIGTAIIGTVAGSKIGTHKGYKSGYHAGWEDRVDLDWSKRCELYGWDPSYTAYDYEAVGGRHRPIKDLIKCLQEKDPEMLISGKFVYDATVKPGYEEKDK